MKALRGLVLIGLMLLSFSVVSADPQDELISVPLSVEERITMDATANSLMANPSAVSGLQATACRRYDTNVYVRGGQVSGSIKFQGKFRGEWQDAENISLDNQGERYWVFSGIEYKRVRIKPVGAAQKWIKFIVPKCTPSGIGFDVYPVVDSDYFIDGKIVAWAHRINPDWSVTWLGKKIGCESHLVTGGISEEVNLELLVDGGLEHMRKLYRFQLFDSEVAAMSEINFDCTLTLNKGAVPYPTVRLAANGGALGWLESIIWFERDQQPYRAATVTLFMDYDQYDAYKAANVERLRGASCELLYGGDTYQMLAEGDPFIGDYAVSLRLHTAEEALPIRMDEATASCSLDGAVVTMSWRNRGDRFGQ